MNSAEFSGERALRPQRERGIKVSNSLVQMQFVRERKVGRETFSALKRIYIWGGGIGGVRGVRKGDRKAQEEVVLRSQWKRTHPLSAARRGEARQFEG